MILNLLIYSGLFYGLARGLCLKESRMRGFRSSRRAFDTRLLDPVGLHGCSKRRFPIDLLPGYSIRL